MSDNLIKQCQQDVANYGDDDCLKLNAIRHKESSELLFSLERAKAGDAVEFEEKQRKWVICNFIFIEKDDFDVKVKQEDGSITWIPLERLRIKCPKT